MLHWAGNLSLPSFYHIFPLLFVIIEPLIIVYYYDEEYNVFVIIEPLIIVYYYDEEYNVFITIEFFPHNWCNDGWKYYKFPWPRHTRTPGSEHFPKFILSLTAGL